MIHALWTVGGQTQVPFGFPSRFDKFTFDIAAVMLEPGNLWHNP